MHGCELLPMVRRCNAQSCSGLLHCTLRLAKQLRWPEFAVSLAWVCRLSVVGGNRPALPCRPAPCPPLCAPACSLESLDKCGECAKGYRVDTASNACMPCSIGNCSTCDDGSRCSACMPGYGLVNPQRDESFQYSTACHACAKADPNCLAW